MSGEVGEIEEDGEIGLREASTVLALHYMTVYRYVRTGKLAARRQGGDWLVRRVDVEALRGTPPIRVGGGAGAGPGMRRASGGW